MKLLFASERELVFLCNGEWRDFCETAVGLLLVGGMETVRRVVASTSQLVYSLTEFRPRSAPRIHLPLADPRA